MEHPAEPAGGPVPHDVALRAKLRWLYRDHTPESLRRTSALLEPHLEAIVDQFYDELLAIRESQAILVHSLVNKRLKAHLREWIARLFTPQTDEQIDALVERQRRIGTVHANVNVTIEQFLYGFGILRYALFERLARSIDPPDAFGETCVALGQILDVLASVVGQAYFENEFTHESNEFALKFKGLQKSTAIECERLRSTLLDWLRVTLNLLYQTPELRLDALPKLQYSTFGMWVVYKADLLSPFNNVQQELQDQVAAIDHALLQAARHRVERDEPAFLDALMTLNDQVTRTSWYLSNLVDELIELDTGLDPLTRLFNRRYLETILRRQAEIARKSALIFAVLVIDVDHFKAVNDTYGHPAGDMVLRQLAEVILVSIRTADFAFRYGGEEFVVSLSNAGEDTALALAERIRANCAQHRFTVAHDQRLTLTCSIGVAVFDGHPDPQRILQRADRALYAAKEAGRNHVSLAPDDG